MRRVAPSSGGARDRPGSGLMTFLLSIITTPAAYHNYRSPLRTTGYSLQLESSSTDAETAHHEDSQPLARRKCRMSRSAAPPPAPHPGPFMVTSTCYRPGAPPIPPVPAQQALFGGGARTMGSMSGAFGLHAAHAQQSMSSEQRFMRAAPPSRQTQSGPRGGSKRGHALAVPAPASKMQHRPIFGAAAASKLAQATGFSLASQEHDTYQREMQAAAQMPVAEEECEESDDAVKVEEGRKSYRLLKLRAMLSDLKRRARSI